MVGGILICSSKLSGGGEHEGGCCVDVGGRGRWQIGLDGEWNGGGREIVRVRKRYIFLFLLEKDMNERNMVTITMIRMINE